MSEGGSKSNQCCATGHSLVGGRDGEGERWIALSVQSRGERDHSSLVVDGEHGLFTGDRMRHADKEIITVIHFFFRDLSNLV